MELDLTGDVALVAASSSGLGRASAKALAREGADVVVNGLDESEVDDAIAEVQEVAVGSVAGHALDLTVEEDVQTLVERTADEFGGIDHLVTNAGGVPTMPFLETTDEDWYEAFDLLVMSVVRLVRHAADYLQDGGGSVVHITSRSVKEAIDGLVLSNSVRMGVIGLEKTLSRELAPEVRVNAVMPGTHETKHIRDLVEQAVEQDEYDSYADGIEDWAEDIPLGRIGQPMELGEVVAFLCSERASFINGEAVRIDGGISRSNL